MKRFVGGSYIILKIAYQGPEFVHFAIRSLDTLYQRPCTGANHPQGSNKHDHIEDGPFIPPAERSISLHFQQYSGLLMTKIFMN